MKSPKEYGELLKKVGRSVARAVNQKKVKK
jgi:hypothetical protein